MGISTYSVYGIDMEDAIRKEFNMTDYGHTSDYQCLLDSIDNLEITDYFFIDDPNGGGNSTVYFGIMIDSVGDSIKQDYINLQNNINNAFNDMKAHIVANIPQDEIDEFVANMECDDFDKAWNKFSKLKSVIARTDPGLISVASYG